MVVLRLPIPEHVGLRLHERRQLPVEGGWNPDQGGPKLIRDWVPVARAICSRVRVEGWARLRAPINAWAKADSGVSSSYASRYSGSSIQWRQSPSCPER